MRARFLAGLLVFGFVLSVVSCKSKEENAADTAKTDKLQEKTKDGSEVVKIEAKEKEQELKKIDDTPIGLDPYVLTPGKDKKKKDDKQIDDNGKVEGPELPKPAEVKKPVETPKKAPDDK